MILQFKTCDLPQSLKSPSEPYLLNFVPCTILRCIGFISLYPWIHSDFPALLLDLRTFLVMSIVLASCVVHLVSHPSFSQFSLVAASRLLRNSAVGNYVNIPLASFFANGHWVALPGCAALISLTFALIPPGYLRILIDICSHLSCHIFIVRTFYSNFSPSFPLIVLKQ